MTPQGLAGEIRLALFLCLEPVERAFLHPPELFDFPAKRLFISSANTIAGPRSETVPAGMQSR